MVRTIKTLYSEIEDLEELIKKKENEIINLKDKIEKNRRLINKKREIENKTVSVKIEEVKTDYNDICPYHVKIRVIETGELFSYVSMERPSKNPYIKITPKWLNQLRETKQRRDRGEFN